MSLSKSVSPLPRQKSATATPMHGDSSGDLLSKLLAAPNAASLIADMLVPRLGLGSLQTELAIGFATQLRQRQRASQQHGLFANHAPLSPELTCSQSLTDYLAQEFFASTNYVAFYKGDASELRLVDQVTSTGKRVVEPQIQVHR